MKLVCPSCNAVYRIPDGKIAGERTRSARCKKCGRTITIHPGNQKRFSAAPSSPGTGTRLEVDADFSLAEIQEMQTADPGRMLSNLDCIRFGWQTVKREPSLTIIGMVIVPFAIQSAAEILLDALPPEAHIASAVPAVTAAVLEMVVTLGIAVLGLKLADGEKAAFKDLHAHYRRVPAYLAASLLTGLLCLLGFALLILPGILFTVWFSFYALAIVDTKAGPLEALKQSYSLARGNFWRITGFWGWIFLLNLLGMIPCGLGLLLTLPITFIAWACLYRNLQGRAPIQTEASGPQNAASGR